MNRRALAAVGAVVAVLVILGVVGTLARQKDDDPPPPPRPGQDAARCQPVTDVTPASGGESHRNGRIEYDRVPPNSGPHAPSTERVLGRVLKGSDEGAVERIVHNLEHGYVVVWYDPSRADMPALELALGTQSTRKAFAAPWPRGPLPAPYVITAWGHEQRCESISPEAVAAFFADHGGENGDAPEAGAA